MEHSLWSSSDSGRHPSLNLPETEMDTRSDSYASRLMARGIWTRTAAMSKDGKLMRSEQDVEIVVGSLLVFGWNRVMNGNLDVEVMALTMTAEEAIPRLDVESLMVQGEIVMEDLTAAITADLQMTAARGELRRDGNCSRSTRALTCPLRHGNSS